MPSAPVAAEPGSTSEERFKILAGLAVTQVPAATPAHLSQPTDRPR
ncbi:hypothetical protein [Streptomyces sp. NPDC055210]